VLVIISLAVIYGTVAGGAFRSQKRAFAAPVTGLTLPGVSASLPAQDQSVLRPSAINKTLRADQPVTRQQQEVAQQLAQINATPTAQVAVEQEDAVVRAAADAPPVEAERYKVYTVQEGDNVSSIAAEHGLDPEYIVANNAEITDSDDLQLGQNIIVPAGNGILHEVRLGETISDIAARYGVEVEAIAAFAANGIVAADEIAEAQLLFVPGGRIPTAEAPPDAEVAPAADPAATPEPDVPDAPSGGESFVDTGPASGSGLIWPIVGPISSPYGGGHPLGIDIDGFNLVGSAVVAATSGTVTFAGGNPCCSYGLYVVVVSPGGIETLYAHLSSISVSEGETVAQGQVVGVIGDTGYSTGTHLHFEVIDNGVRQNPTSYLP
jgi:murein DD-endopeptidase MepM/ murein hydrolase activator NlpD